MQNHKTVSALVGLFASAAVFAQGGTPTPTPGAQSTDPGAASTPHQRAAVKSSGDETPAATSGTSPSDSATPSQKDAVKKKKHKAKTNPDAAAPASP